jgi:hypothetical protein
MSRPHLPPERERWQPQALFSYTHYKSGTVEMKGEQKHFMSWIGWVVVIIMVFNVVFFSALIIYDLIREWRDKHE